MMMSTAFEAREIGRLRKVVSWPRVFGASVLILIFGAGVGRRIFHAVVNPDGLWRIVFAIIVLRLLLEMPTGWQRGIAVRKNGAGLGGMLMAFLPREIVALFLLNNSLLGGFWGWLRKRPVGSAMAGQQFHYMDKSQYGTFFAMALISFAVDIPVSSLIIGIMTHDPVRRHWIHLIIFGLTLYALILLLGDRWLLKSDAHVLDGQYLHVRLGSRFAADIPLDRIASTESSSVSLEAWRRDTGVKADEMVIVGPAGGLDGFNVIVHIREGAPIPMRRNMLSGQLSACVLMQVDAPGALRGALAG
jgi:hypothetical protein